MSTIISDELPGESSPDSVLAPQGFVNLGNFKLPDSKKSKRDHGAAASTPAWAIAEEFDALDQQGALLEGGGSVAAPSSSQSNFSLPALGVTSNHSRTADFFVRTKDGFLCSKPLTSDDLLMLEAGVGAKHGTLCKLFFGPKPAVKLVKTPRGSKSTEHEAVLRQSNPCYGSLAPNLTRPNCAEVSYDPLKRFNVIGDKVPRGFKSVEDLEILRTSEPCFGSLNPDTTRPNRAEYSYSPLKRFAAVGQKKMARGYKGTEHLAILRTSSPLYSSLAPDLTRPNRAEYSFDPLKRFAAVGDKVPRGFKSLEHLEVLRTSDPAYGSLAPDLTRPNCAEVSYDPLKRFAAVSDRLPRGAKNEEHLAILRTSDPCLSSLAPDLTRPNRAEHSYNPLKRFATIGDKAPRGFKSTEHVEVLRQSDPSYGSLQPDLTRPNHAEYSFEPLRRFAALSKRIGRGFKSTEHEEILRQSSPGFGSLAPDLTRPSCAEYSFDPLKRFAAIGERLPRGAKSVEHLALLRASDPCLGSLAPDATRPNRAEYSYDPLRRYAAIGDKKMARGFKSLEHAEVLRQSDPSYGSLQPDATRPNRAEYSYDPLKRFAAIGERLPRGAKSVEHLALLRASDPCLGSLAPDATRPNRAEYSYDPLRRYAAIGDKKMARGFKSLEHAEVLRTSNPTYGTLAPSLRGSRVEYSFDPRKRFAALAWTAREPRGSKTAAHLAILRTSDPTYGTLAPSRTRQPPAVVSSLAAVGPLRGLTRVVSVDGLDGWQNITPDAAAPAMEEQAARLPEVGLQLPEWPEEQSDDDDDGEADDEADDDALPDLPGWGSSRRRQPRASSMSFDSDSASMARTADRDWNEPRASNDTIASFMDDSNDGHASGEWAGYQMSPRKAKPAKAAAGGKFPAAKAALEGPAEDGPKHPGNAAAWGWAATSH